ncbi:MAG: hypothetical protein IPM21_13215 [Acidobacteria bacterium]|nr:hypothetical protein [Acidobacteriota bacterium]
MKAKHSVILLSGLLLLMIAAAWAQTSDTVRPTCPAVIYNWNANYRPDNNASKWLRADWNANADRWEIDCSSELPSANAVNRASNMSSNGAMYNATNAVQANAAANTNARTRKKTRP